MNILLCLEYVYCHSHNIQHDSWTVEYAVFFYPHCIDYHLTLLPFINTQIMSKQPPKKTSCENTLTQLWPVREVPLVTPKKVYVIKQSEASKKRKAQKQDDLKNCAVAKRSEGADTDEYEDPGPGDYVVHQTAGGGSIPMIVPTSILGCDKGLCLEEDPSIWYICKDAPGKKTLIPVDNFWNYIVHSKYISLVHAKLCGKMVEWKDSVLEAISLLDQAHKYSWTALRGQYHWANESLDAIMEGIQMQDVVPVTILNEIAMMQMVNGVDDEEKADFVIRMGNCETFTIAIVKDTKRNNVSIVTFFDKDPDTQIAYGKGKVKDLSVFEHLAEPY
jgi:hypothetical protein